jgi:hypothetical protein
MPKNDWISMSEEDLVDAIANAKTTEEKKAIGAFLKRRLNSDAQSAQERYSSRSAALNQLIGDLQTTLSGLPSQSGKRTKSTLLERLLDDARRAHSG